MGCELLSPSPRVSPPPRGVVPVPGGARGGGQRLFPGETGLELTLSEDSYGSQKISDPQAQALPGGFLSPWCPNCLPRFRLSPLTVPATHTAVTAQTPGAAQDERGAVWALLAHCIRGVCNTNNTAGAARGSTDPPSRQAGGSAPSAWAAQRGLSSRLPITAGLSAFLPAPPAAGTPGEGSALLPGPLQQPDEASPFGRALSPPSLSLCHQGHGCWDRTDSGYHPSGKSRSPPGGPAGPALTRPPQLWPPPHSAPNGGAGVLLWMLGSV